MISMVITTRPEEMCVGGGGGGAGGCVGLDARKHICAYVMMCEENGDFGGEVGRKVPPCLRGLFVSGSVGAKATVHFLSVPSICNIQCLY